MRVHRVAKESDTTEAPSMHAHGRGYRVKPGEWILFTGPSQSPSSLGFSINEMCVCAQGEWLDLSPLL